MYLTSPIEVDVRLDDSIKVYSASGTADLPTYIQNTVRIDGGEDINTTALALESGGNLDIIAMDTTSLDNKIDGSILGGITYDEIDVARDANGNISSFDYQLAAVSQAVITVTRNGAGEITNIVRS
ncbi:MAG: hypothetical protein DRP42_02785 [Tenericutes bacterium]|nr:MAG: hypothetical protein DRP42_02785 [Mycoplasmatota bacterium]